MLAPPEQPTNSEAPLQLLLFVDKRPISRQHIRQIRTYLQQVKTEYPFDLQVIDVGEQPYLAEHFKLIATPSLIKIHPEPKQTLAGSNLIAQLEHCWSRWQRSAEEFIAQQQPLTQTLQPENIREIGTTSISCSVEMMQLSDEIFRLKQENEELSAQLHFKDRLIAMLAHDLRNPLTAVSIAIETLETHYKPQGSQHFNLSPSLTAQLLKHARTQTRTIEKMIADLLEADRGAKACFSSVPQRLDLIALCLDVIQQFKTRLNAKSQILKTDLPSDLPLVYADPERIHQVMMNLLDNANKYTPEGGTIQVSALHRTTQRVQVTICDTGKGIPEESQKEIFEDRFRLQRDKTEEGYGIGLSLCQRIIRAHHGQIWVDSSPSSGSCFHFTLPVYQR
ncbi:MAG TPA: histidine kinase [Halomicronema sp.]